MFNDHLMILFARFMILLDFLNTKDKKGGQIIHSPILSRSLHTGFIHTTEQLLQCFVRVNLVLLTTSYYCMLSIKNNIL